MDNIQSVKSQLRLKEWARQIAECQNSTMTVKAWCEAHGINPKTYYYRLRKVRKNTLENMPAIAGNMPAVQEKRPIAFKPLEVQSPVFGMQAAVTVHLHNATLEVAQGTDQRTVEAVLLALKSIC